MSIFYEVSLNLSVSEVERVYQGNAQRVVARLKDGRSIQFPARALRSIVDKEGVHGEFVLEVDDEGKYFGIRKK